MQNLPKARKCCVCSNAWYLSADWCHLGGFVFMYWTEKFSLEVDKVERVLLGNYALACTFLFLGQPRVINKTFLCIEYSFFCPFFDFTLPGKHLLKKLSQFRIAGGVLWKVLTKIFQMIWSLPKRNTFLELLCSNSNSFLYSIFFFQSLFRTHTTRKTPL